MPDKNGEQRTWIGLRGSADIAAVAELISQHSGLTLVITENSATARRWSGALPFFLTACNPSRADGALQFPDWETLPYDAFSPHQDITSERIRTLSRLPLTEQGFLTVPITTLLQRVAPRTFLQGESFEFRRGARLDIHQQRQLLDEAGYRHTETVRERGEYAVRGAVLDLFPMGAELPIRVDLFDDEIDTLRTFDPDTQRTVENISQLKLLPAKEFPFDATAISRFRDRWHNTFNVDVRRCSVYQDVSSNIAPNGVEYYLPFFFDTLGTLFDYLPSNVLVVAESGVFAAAEHHLADVEARYESLRYDVERPILPPADLYLRLDELHAQLAAFRQVRLLNPAAGADSSPPKHAWQAQVTGLPDITADGRSNTALAPLKDFLSQHPHPVLFTAETAGRREIFDELLRKNGIVTRTVDSLSEFLEQDQHGICVSPLQEGLCWQSLAIVTEADVLGTRQVDHKVERNRVIDPDQVVRNLTELSLGAPVVHIQHGVGRYQGLQSLTIDGESHEFLTLLYADEDKLYVPVTALHLISRYAGSDEEHAPLHRLGSDQWEKAKKKAAEKVVDVAAELLDIYARRELKKSHRFNLSQSDYDAFAAQFPFEVTADQEAAIADTLADMTTERAMDRLICGDVGFGKTEVAMRAAFVAVQEGYQVAILVPTTLLAQQHYDSFCDRFAAWPVRIESISRLRAQSDIDDVQSRLTSGQVDIVVGTHKLLSQETKFKNLGLIIIDEEHRFGVRQKERLKSMRAEVDVLTLTATPIPRTLNMAVNGVRDLSIIATPPARRLSIKTFVQEKRNSVVREAISRELLRGGQVFYLHNEVKTIQQTAIELADMIPEARIGVGHGQMAKRELESAMSDFYHRRLNILVCTTIIETGIDIPNANTIIIERADKFGLAQLHQLRGRVGRSHRQAYAYLLTPHRKAMTNDAIKRLDAIEAAGELGVGFTLATHDMEIRGAGELLGEDQSGQIESVGFSLYMQLLNRAIETIRRGEVPDAGMPLEPVSQEVNLHAATLIPDDYLPDVHTRLILYKRIANATSEEELDRLQIEVIDRFGLLPPPLKRLFAVTLVKLVSQALGIEKVDVGPERGRLEFSQATRVDPIKIVQLVQNQPNTYRLEGAAKLRFTHAMEEFEDRLEFVNKLLDDLTPT